MQSDKRPTVALSYRTSTDSWLAEALEGELAKLGIAAEKLPYLTFKGFPITAEESEIKLKVDAWIDHFMTILENSVGMVVISTENSRGSVGMAIERQLVKQLAPSDEDFTIVLNYPFNSYGLEATGWEVSTPDNVIEQGSKNIRGMSSSVWAEQCVQIMRSWIERRVEVGPKGVSRHSAENVNPKGNYYNYEIQYTNTDMTWFKISVRDLYDRVWHCKRCYATSDNWSNTDYRPPEKCPACGFQGHRPTS